MDASTTTSSGYRQPALIGGAVAGVLSALPFVSAFNACCCLWVITGGLVAAYLLQQNRPTPISAGDGAMVGLFAGFVGAFVMFLISIPLSLIMGPMERAMFERLSSASGNMPPEMREMLGNLSDRESVGFLGQMVFRLIGLVAFLVAGTVFSTLGGLLGAAIFAKKTNAQ